MRSGQALRRVAEPEAGERRRGRSSDPTGFLINEQKLVASLLLIAEAPSMALVTVPECCFSTPRIIMQKCWASQYDPDTLGSKMLLQTASDFLGEPFLDLQPARQRIDDARDLT